MLSQSIVERDILKQEYEIIATKFAKHVGVDYSKPACTSCHRREGHNRANCPFKGFPCKSAEFCGDLNKHKDEKDTVTLPGIDFKLQTRHWKNKWKISHQKERSKPKLHNLLVSHCVQDLMNVRNVTLIHLEEKTGDKSIWI